MISTRVRIPEKDEKKLFLSHFTVARYLSKQQDEQSAAEFAHTTTRCIKIFFHLID